MRKRQSFSAQICTLPTPPTEIKMHVRKELPLCMGDGGEVRWGSEIMCDVSLTSHHSNKQDNICAMCVSFLSCKKETERKWKGSLSLSFIKPSCACCNFAYSIILQLIQFLDNPLSHQIQNTVKLTFSLQSHTTTSTALLTQVSILLRSFLLAKTFYSYKLFFIFFWSNHFFFLVNLKKSHLGRFFMGILQTFR